MKETETKNYISQALIKLLETNNLDNITITLLCNKAGTSRMSFYRYFKNINDVIEYYLNQKYTLFTDNLKLISIRKKDLLEQLNYIFKYIQDNYKILEILRKIDFNILNFNKLDFIPFNKNKYENYFYTGAIINISKYWIENGMEETTEELSNIVYNIIKKNNSSI